MADINIADVIVEISARLDRLEQGLAQAEQKVRGATDRMTKSASTFAERFAQEMVGAFSAVTAAVLAATAAMEGFNKSTEQRLRARGGAFHDTLGIGGFDTKIPTSVFQTLRDRLKSIPVFGELVRRGELSSPQGRDELRIAGETERLVNETTHQRERALRVQLAEREVMEATLDIERQLRAALSGRHVELKRIAELQDARERKLERLQRSGGRDIGAIERLGMLEEQLINIESRREFARTDTRQSIDTPFGSFFVAGAFSERPVATLDVLMEMNDSLSKIEDNTGKAVLD